jgi:hypothetical protein
MGASNTMLSLPQDTSCRAEYSDGFILDETELSDTNPYGDGNTLRAILNKSAEEDHGKMVTFSVFYKNTRYDIDWESLPANARPIRFRDGASYLGIDGQESSEWTGMRFGFQYNDKDGKNVQQVEEL